MLSFEKVGKIYPQSKASTLKDVSFSINEGEFVCLIGPSGEGKTTILKIIAGIEEPTSGKVIKPNTISMDFQSSALFPWLSVFDNIAIGLRAINTSESIVKRNVDKYLQMMKLEEFKDKLPSDLSGGQRQRVGIARALAIDPQVLLLDEPFSALDAKTTAELHEDLLNIWKETKKTIIMVSHSIEEAVSLSERILLIKNSSIESEFIINLTYPRREQATEYMNKVNHIRREFFK